MLADDDACRAQHAGKQDEGAEPSCGIELEDKAVREQSAYHHAAACRMGADFPLDVDKCADDHAEQGGYDDASHVTGQVVAVHGEDASGIAQDGERVGDEPAFALAQFVKRPSVDFLHQVNAEHGQQDGEAIHDAEYGQLVPEGQDVEVSERKKQDERYEREHERGEYRGNDARCPVQRVFRPVAFVRLRFVIRQLAGNVCFFHIRLFYLLNRATGMFSCWRYLDTVRRASG